MDAIITDILRREGWPAYTDHPADRGGPTKGGVTLRTLTAWRGRPCTGADVAALTEDEVRAIYRRQYMEQPGYAGIADPDLCGLVVDCAVLYGPTTASPWLQVAVNKAVGTALLTVDGAVGPKTIAAVNSLPPKVLALLVLSERTRKTGRIVTDDARKRGRREDQSLNAAGWCNRLADLLDAVALALPRP